MDLAPKLQFHPMPLPRPWPRRAHRNHCLVNVRSRWLRVVVFVVFSPIWARCRLNVESMWVLFPYTNVTMWTRAGLAADPSPHLEHVVVYQIGTRSPFGIYNIIGGVSGRVHMATTATFKNPNRQHKLMKPMWPRCGLDAD